MAKISSQVGQLASWKFSNKQVFASGKKENFKPCVLQYIYL